MIPAPAQLGVERVEGVRLANTGRPSGLLEVALQELVQGRVRARIASLVDLVNQPGAEPSAPHREHSARPGWSHAT